MCENWTKVQVVSLRRLKAFSTEAMLDQRQCEECAFCLKL